MDNCSIKPLWVGEYPVSADPTIPIISLGPLVLGMYEAVRVAAEGQTTVARFAATVARVGFDGMVVRNRQSDLADYDPAALGERYGIDVVPGIEIDTTDRSVASGTIGHRRSEATVLLVRGRTPEINRFAAESPRVDVLSDPMSGEGDINHVIVKAAAENDVALEFNLGRVLRRSGGARVQALRGLRKLREIVDHYDAPFVVSADPTTHLQVRAPRELVALGELIGFEGDQLQEGLERWGEIASKHRRRDDPDYIAPGVRRGPPEDDSE